MRAEKLEFKVPLACYFFNRKLTSLVLLGLTITFSASAQEPSVALHNYFAAVRDGSETALPYNVLRQPRAFDTNRELLTNHLTDTLPDSRRACYLLLDVLQQGSTNPEEKAQILELQFLGLEDPVPGHMGLTISNLASVPSAIFDSGQKTVLIVLLRRDVPRKEELITKVGALGEISAISSLKPFAQGGNPPKVRWAAYLALSRLGDEESILLVQNKVRGLQVDDGMVFDIAPCVIYTRSKLLYDYLVELLYSEEQNCESADPDRPAAINCAYRILELLAPEIADFPLSTTASGDLLTTNYREALQTARAWFEANANYQIKSAND